MYGMNITDVYSDFINCTYKENEGITTTFIIKNSLFQPHLVYFYYVLLVYYYKRRLNI